MEKLNIHLKLNTLIRLEKSNHFNRSIKTILKDHPALIKKFTSFSLYLN